MKLLVVDDSSVTRKIIKAVADALNMQAEEAADGIEALEILAERHSEFDLVLLDWNMPDKSGFDVLLEIKEDENMHDLPVMMVTTEGQKTSIVAAIKAGAANYLTKPFTVEDLVIKINECIGWGGDL
ncbi:MAG: response regulator [Oscillospiraceae bacterium]|nr:response regulator [Oscillospiraceae bacterium]